MVLSPPCGMATEEDFFVALNKELSSKPTVWDGDHTGYETNLTLFVGSKPTVWDGD